MPQLTVEPYRGPSEAPCVSVVVKNAGTTRATITRSDGKDTSVVRGAASLEVLGEGYVIDYDVPASGTVTYTATLANGETYTATHTASSQLGWITDPYDPAKAVSYATNTDVTADLYLLKASAAQITRKAPVTAVEILAGKAPVAIAGNRQSGENIDLAWVATNEENADKARNLFNSTSICIIRPPADDTVLTPTTWLALPEITEQWRRAGTRARGLVVFQTTAQVVRRLSHAVVWEKWTLAEVESMWVRAGWKMNTLDAYATSRVRTLAALERDPKMGGLL